MLVADWTAASSATIANAALHALNVLLGVAVTSAATSRVVMLSSPVWLPTSTVARVVETLLGRIPLQLPPPTMATLAWQQPRHGALWRATRATQMLVQLCLMYIPQWRDCDASTTSRDSFREDGDAHEARVTAIVVQLCGRFNAGQQNARCFFIAYDTTDACSDNRRLATSTGDAVSYGLVANGCCDARYLAE
eukprot:gene522-353_t